MTNFGWSYPAGCSDSDIDAALGANDSPIEVYEEWASEAHQHLTKIFSLVTELAANGKLSSDEAASIFAEVMQGQGWLENIIGQGKEPQQS